MEDNYKEMQKYFNKRRELKLSVDCNRERLDAIIKILEGRKKEVEEFEVRKEELITQLSNSLNALNEHEKNMREKHEMINL